MANVLTDTSAPYVIAVAIGAVGWLVTTSVEELKQSHIVEYSIARKAVSGQHYVNVDIHNRSMSKSISSGNFTFRCPGTVDTTCFGNGEPVVRASPLRGISFKSEIGKSGPVYTAAARLAPQSSIRYSIKVASRAKTIVLFYEAEHMDDGKLAGIIFREGYSWEGWLIEHYVTALFFVFAGLIMLLSSWIVISAWFALWPRHVEQIAQEPPVTKMLVELRRPTDA